MATNPSGFTVYPIVSWLQPLHIKQMGSQ